jgi:hypothetical protein
MITATNPLTTPPAELPPTSPASTSAAVTSFADQLATAGENSTSSPAIQQDSFLQYFLGAASTAAPPVPTPSVAEPVISTVAVASTSTSPAPPSVNFSAVPQDAPAYSISSTAPYFTPAPDQYTTVTPTGGMKPFQADSMDSYMQKFIGQSVSDMYGFISGTQGWANGGSAAITDNFVSMVQQRITAYPSMGQGIDPQAMGTQYANLFMKVLSGVQVSQLGATNFSGSVLDFLNQGGSPEPTVLNQAPAVMNA